MFLEHPKFQIKREKLVVLPNKNHLIHVKKAQFTNSRAAQKWWIIFKLVVVDHQYAQVLKKQITILSNINLQ